MHFLDLPILARQPSVAQIEAALTALAPAAADNFDQTETLDKGTRQWLSRLASADLAWIDDDRAEALRSAAAHRLAEACGVTASAGRLRNVDIGRPEPVRLKEPGVTEDQLGKLTWGSSLALSRRLVRTPALVSGRRCIELGAGTGLCAIAAALCGATTVHATDLPEIVPNLTGNVALNGVSEVCTCYALDWAAMPLATAPEPFDVCIVSDPVYSRDHPPLLLAAVRWLRAPVVLLQLPLRRGFEAEREAIYGGLEAAGYARTEYAEEEGRDLFGAQQFAYSKWGML